MSGAGMTNVPGGIHLVVRTPHQGAEHRYGPLRHGQSPAELLAEEGWRPVRAVGTSRGPGGELFLHYTVWPWHRPAGAATAPTSVPRDADVGPDEVGTPHLRVAAYAVVVDDPRVLLTEYSTETARPGEWGLPGGGLDVGEDPVDAVRREVWEETGQHVEIGGLLEVQSAHWIGKPPEGPLEDFHAIRIVYAATCHEPTDTVVHDVGGTTADARWVPIDQLPDYALSSSWADLLHLLASVGETGA